MYHINLSKKAIHTPSLEENKSPMPPRPYGRP
jgi:hypothetical protein